MSVSIGEKIQLPELFFGLAAPIGTDLKCVSHELELNLRSFGYSVIDIKVSDLISQMGSFQLLSEHPEFTERNPSTYEEKIRAGNQIRSITKSANILAKAVCSYIQFQRQEQKIGKGIINRDQLALMDDNARQDVFSRPIPATAYIISQLKRPEEVNLLRETYGAHFVLISANSSYDQKHSNLVNQIGQKQINLTANERAELARKLIEDDAEQGDDFGQLISETYHLADFFIEASNRASVQAAMQRFIRAFFGSNRVSPTKDEYGSYFSKAASLKSVDLSRQVGSAIFTRDGDIVSTGCNDVAKSGGGQFWEDDFEKFRDIDMGSETNKEETNRIIFNFIKTLIDQSVITDAVHPQEILAKDEVREAISSSMIGEITEYGRMIHAEMAAITDAARQGRSLKDTTMYVTTYPCHNCAKHIISSGIKKVIYIEPYPKSRAVMLYGKAIKETATSDEVSFEHFYGISPRIYRTIFEKSGKRRDKMGNILEWCSSAPKPLIQNYDYDATELNANNSFRDQMLPITDAVGDED
jgi:deoxycytidylate deaminase